LALPDPDVVVGPPDEAVVVGVEVFDELPQADMAAATISARGIRRFNGYLLLVSDGLRF
jgi:hypothetical protein